MHLHVCGTSLGLQGDPKIALLILVAPKKGASCSICGHCNSAAYSGMFPKNSWGHIWQALVECSISLLSLRPF